MNNWKRYAYHLKFFKDLIRFHNLFVFTISIPLHSQLIRRSETLKSIAEYRCSFYRKGLWVWWKKYEKKIQQKLLAALGRIRLAYSQDSGKVIGNVLWLRRNICSHCIRVVWHHRIQSRWWELSNVHTKSDIELAKKYSSADLLWRNTKALKFSVHDSWALRKNSF